MHVRTARPIAKLKQGRNDWYRIFNQTDTDSAEIYIYDEIGYWGVTAQDFVKDLLGVSASQIDVHLNTPGGEVFDGIAIYNALKQHKANVTMYVDSLAASIGSVIAMAGNEVYMAKNATMMIHDGHGVVVGNAADMREMADLLDRTSDNIASIYVDKAGKDVEYWRDLMRAETWFSMSEAIDAGLAEEMPTDPKKKSKMPMEDSWDLSIFRYAGREKAPTPTGHVPSPPVKVSPGEPVTVEETALAFDPAEFRAAMSFALNPPVPQEEAPFTFDPEVFKLMLANVANNAPAIAQSPKTEEPTFDSVYDPELVREVIKERISK